MKETEKKIEAVDKKVEQVEEVVNEREHSFAWELVVNARRDGGRWFMVAMTIFILSSLVIGGIVFHFTNKIDRMNERFAESIEVINKQHLDYLLEYDFSGTTEITVDGQEGTALYQDGEGNTLNNGEGYKESN